MRTDVRVTEADTYTLDVCARTPLKFGAVVVERLPLALARVEVENRAGDVEEGWGGMLLMDQWAWPDAQASESARSRAMVDVLEGFARAAQAVTVPDHPIGIFMALESELGYVATEASARHTPGEQMPRLAALVAASAVDHAVHDAFGKAAGIDSYLGYGPEHMAHDLSRYLGPAYRSVYPSQFLRPAYVPRIPVFHLVGGLDALTEADVSEDAPDDGLPNSLERWIERDGVHCLKVKLRGTDLEWDIDRTVAVSAIYHEVRSARADLPPVLHLSVDTNEQCASPEYMVEYLRRIRERAPDVLQEIAYLEQPTERDLSARRWDMRPLADMKPVLVDESFASPSDFEMARELGWSGVALKSCKCLSSALLLMSMAAMNGIPYAVQDLTNPSLALLESVGLAARTHTILGVEANSRQFFPEANRAVGRVHPGFCEVHNGYAHTESLRGPGLGLRIDEIGVDRLLGRAE